MTMTEAHTVDIGHTQQSSLREKVLEHLFVGELLRSLWCKGIRNIEVLRAEVDCGGYDLVLGCNGVTRYIQLKATRQEGRRQHVDINVALAEKPGGCVIWFWFDEVTLKLGPFLWFGSPPGERIPCLGDKVGRHTRGEKRERASIRIISKAKFKRLDSVDEVARELFQG